MIKRSWQLTPDFWVYSHFASPKAVKGFFLKRKNKTAASRIRQDREKSAKNDKARFVFTRQYLQPVWEKRGPLFSLYAIKKDKMPAAEKSFIVVPDQGIK